MLFAIVFRCGNVEYHEFDCETDAWIAFPTAVEIEAEGYNDDYDYMDGDAESALASAGWGEDESYWPESDYGYEDDGRWDE